MPQSDGGSGGRLRVLVSAGGSGGHVFPAQAFAEALEAADPSIETVFVTGEKFSSGRDFFDDLPAGRVLRVRSAAFRGIRSAVSPSFYAALGRGYKDSRSAVAKMKPALVAGFGGHHTVPIVFAARAAGIPTLLHEQNAVFGLANKLLARFATRVGCAFDDSVRGRSRAFWAGMPLRPGLERLPRERAAEALGLDPSKKTLLVTGGSQGARAVNDAVLKFAAQHGEELKNRWQIVHLCGAADFERVNAFYETCPAASKRFAFYKDMSAAYSAADLVLSRAGAVTLHELAFFRKCAILVPYPAANGHQLENARVLVKQGGAWLVEQSALSAQRIFEIVADVERDPAGAKQTAEKCGQALKIGTGELVAEALKLCGRGRTEKHAV